ncbi:stage II sporulation protein R [Clostridium sp. DSM 8431]|uniref:stage II sporulation protein R n=1 Tax=Clostridium sp. DSM 8431 TaxID=1761781 RepID=UPI0008ECE6B6|nr:stage II sporulation protein R [Clostridium sp. DSM 8431]SFU49923.1 stage II sporulation protein R [Clostridium sp. DSM 8431]
MKKNIKIVFVLLVMLSFIFTGCTSFNKLGVLASCSYVNEEKVYNYDDVKDTVIRFHVLANSDSEEDQNLKLKVRDEILNYLQPCLKDLESIEESRKKILEKKDEIKKIALKVIKENGYNYDVKAELARENFPEKSYGNITLPQGNYEAFRVIIGNGEGHNWWCVMFPSLCFIDVTKGKVEEEESREKLDKVVEENKNHVKVKFKIVEIFNKFFK